jgi:hypothetical protein
VVAVDTRPHTGLLGTAGRAAAVGRIAVFVGCLLMSAAERSMRRTAGTGARSLVDLKTAVAGKVRSTLRLLASYLSDVDGH